MPLKIELKPNERIIIGEALITNDNERIHFFIEGEAPILRERFIMREAEANTPCRRIYYVVQGMYLSKDISELSRIYFKLVRDLKEAAPSFIPLIFDINEAIVAGDYYAAIKAADKLIKREDELFGETLRTGMINGNI